MRHRSLTAVVFMAILFLGTAQQADAQTYVRVGSEVPVTYTTYYPSTWTYTYPTYVYPSYRYTYSYPVIWRGTTSYPIVYDNAWYWDSSPRVIYDWDRVYRGRMWRR
jgi:hypothetical protein